MRRASQLFCLLVLYLFIFLGTRYMLKTVCLFIIEFKMLDRYVAGTVFNL